MSTTPSSPSHNELRQTTIIHRDIPTSIELTPIPEDEKMEEEEEEKEHKEIPKRKSNPKLSKRKNRMNSVIIKRANIDEPEPNYEFNRPNHQKMEVRKWLDRIYYTTTYGWEYSRVAFGYQSFQSIVIGISVINCIVASLPQYWDLQIYTIEVLERLCIAVFTMDYIIRAITVRPSKRLRWFLKLPQIIDVLAILPFYIEVIIRGINFNPSDVSALVILRTLRLFKIIRTLKIARYSTLIPIFARALVKSKEGFLLFVITVSIIMVILSSVMFYAEQSVMAFDEKSRSWLLPDGKMAPFQSIPMSFWWFLVTITTVGYGDSVPASDLGRAIAAFSMIAGLFIFAVPLAVFGKNFTSAWDERDEKIRLRKLGDFIKKQRSSNDISMDEISLVNKINERTRELNKKIEEHKESLNAILDSQQELNYLMSVLHNKIIQKHQKNNNSDDEVIPLDSNVNFI